MPRAVHGIAEVTALGAPGWAIDLACIGSFQIPNAMPKIADVADLQPA